MKPETLPDESAGSPQKSEEQHPVHVMAIHEAGHAVVGRLFGRKIERIVFLPPESIGDGKATWRGCVEWDPDLDPPPDRERQILSILAGCGAEEIIFGRFVAGRHEWEEAREEAWRMGLLDGVGWKDRAAMLRWTTRQTRRRLLEVRRLLAHNLIAVAALADEIVERIGERIGKRIAERMELSGPQAEAIIASELSGK